MKLAIYAITKNEEAHVDRFFNAVLPELKPGDSVTICDTGSTDNTVVALREREYQSVKNRKPGDPKVIIKEITISPWRFDDARNASLALTPADAEIAWSLDLDEVPQPGWREAIENDWPRRPNNRQARRAKRARQAPITTRLKYKYVWSWLEDGSPGVVYYADKLHLRHGFQWRIPCHEMLSYAHGIESHAVSESLLLHHYADDSKPRSSYNELMEKAYAEYPNNDRVQHYYARQLFMQGDMVNAARVFEEHLANPAATWRHERAESMMYLAQTAPNVPWMHQWIYRAVAECPERRETWLMLAEFERANGNKDLGYAFLQSALVRREEQFYLSRPEARTSALFDRLRRWREEDSQHELSSEVPGGPGVSERAGTEAS